MGKMGRLMPSFILGPIAVLLLVSSSFACLGARPLAMGGAFIAVADDVQACYWNPAGLTQLGALRQSYHLTGMYTINNRDLINYQEWVAYAQPYSDTVAWGISYVHEKIRNALGGDYINSQWVVGSLGFKVTKELSLGGNLRGYFDTWKYQAKWDNVSALGLDLAAFYKLSPKVNLGILIQDVNEPEETFTIPPHQLTYQHIRNIRGGIAYRPDATTTIALDIYYLTFENASEAGAEGQSEVRIGLEKWITENIAIRAGTYGWDFQTVGLGYRTKLAPLVILELDYALLSSHDYHPPTELRPGTHLISITVKF